MMAEKGIFSRKCRKTIKPIFSSAVSLSSLIGKGSSPNPQPFSMPKQKQQQQQQQQNIPSFFNLDDTFVRMSFFMQRMQFSCQSICLLAIICLFLD